MRTVFLLLIGYVLSSSSVDQFRREVDNCNNWFLMENLHEKDPIEWLEHRVEYQIGKLNDAYDKIDLGDRTDELESLRSSTIAKFHKGLEGHVAWFMKLQVTRELARYKQKNMVDREALLGMKRKLDRIPHDKRDPALIAEIEQELAATEPGCIIS